MGYNLYIGNAKLVESDGAWEAGVDLLDVEEPLIIPGDTDGPQRFPSYIQWRHFAQMAQIESMFYNPDEGLLRRHPGCFLLTEDHLTEVRAALAAARVKFPNDPVEFPIQREGETEEQFEEREAQVTDGTGVLVRLTWLEFWIAKALELCERPAFCNS